MAEFRCVQKPIFIPQFIKKEFGRRNVNVIILLNTIDLNLILKKIQKKLCVTEVENKLAQFAKSLFFFFFFFCDGLNELA